jgi:hypothetical protein
MAVRRDNFFAHCVRRQVMQALARHIAGGSLEACRAALVAARALADQGAASPALLPQLFGAALLPELLLACADVCSEARLRFPRHARCILRPCPARGVQSMRPEGD